MKIFKIIPIFIKSAIHYLIYLLNKLFVWRNHDSVSFGKYFQIRWKEPMGNINCPYLYRWTLIIFGYSIRLHHWIKSDDNRHFHDHSCNLISMIIKGWYYNVVPQFPDYPNVMLYRKIKAKAFKPWRSNAYAKHYLEIPKEGAWTILLCGRPYHKWGFYVKNKITGKYVKWRPLRYFSKYGIIQDENYQ